MTDPPERLRQVYVDAALAYLQDGYFPVLVLAGYPEAIREARYLRHEVVDRIHSGDYAAARDNFAEFLKGASAAQLFTNESRNSLIYTVLDALAKL